jgi:ectoine hydroxylase-related dioxygenase (phytanoyl-CoA dioxygenase family)
MTQAIDLPTPKTISAEQQASYLETGYLLLESFVSADVVDSLLAATEEMVNRSRAVTASDSIFDLEPGHTADEPRLRRVSSPVDHHPEYWRFAQGSIADLAADLVGPDVRYHHSKLNFKWPDGGEEVKWHQDITFWPHTNYSPLTIGVYLTDVDEDQGPLAVVEDSHEGELFDQYSEGGTWIGCLRDADAAQVPADKVRYLEGPAGSVTVHNCRAIHGSKKNLSARGRPLLLNVYSAADAVPYTDSPIASPHCGDIVRGQAARWARHDPRPCLIPPDWSGGYTSIYALQQEEEGA